MNAHTTSTTAARSATPRVEPLLISALVLAAVLIVQLGVRAGAGSPEPAALGDMVASSGGYTMMTTAAIDGEEQLYVLDNRTETMLVYGIGQPSALLLLGRESLADVFANARAQIGGRR
jgi:hypothetical protein